MIINKIHVENFGCLHNYNLSFNDKLNIIEENNGFGKTTLANFIKAMFYGISSNKKGINENDRLKYAPWQGGKFGGNLVFTYEDKEYRIERYFDIKSQTKDTFKLFDNKTKKESFDFDKNLGEVLFKVDVDAYLRTAYLPKQDYPWIINNSIMANLSNMLDDSSDISNFDSATLTIKNKMKEYVKVGNKGKIAETEENIHACELQLEVAESAKNSTLRLTSTVEKLDEVIIANKQALQEIREKIKICNQQKEKEALVNHLQDLQTKYETAKKDKEDLDNFFKDNLVTKEQLDEYFNKYNRIQNNNEAIAQLSEPDSSLREYIRLNKYFHLDEQSLIEDSIEKSMKDKIDKNKGLTKQYEDLKIQREQLSIKMDDLTDKIANETISTPTHKVIYILFLCISVFLLIPGIALLFTYYSEFLGIVFGASLTILGVIVLITSGSLLIFQNNKVNAKNKALIKLQKEYEDEFILLEQQYRDLELKCQTIKKQVFTFILQYEEPEIDTSKRIIENIIDNEKDYQTALTKIESNWQLWQTFKNSQKDKSDRILKLKNESHLLKKEIITFIGLYTSSTDIFSSLNKIKEKLSIYELKNDIYGNAKNELNEFTNNNDIIATSNDDSYNLDELEFEENALITLIDQKKDEKTINQKKLEESLSLADEITFYQTHLEDLNEMLKTYQKNYSLLNKTTEFLSNAKDSLSTTYLQNMQEEFENIFNQLVKNEHDEFMFNGELELISNAYGETKNLDYYSSGSQDIIIFAAHLALVKSIYQEEKPCLILDDPFTNLDNEKLEQAKELIKKVSNTYQIIYMICHDSRTIN